MDSYRLLLHLMPPQGWLNDPNGLCQMNGIFHVFFQYSPEDANGGQKFWGHYISKDLIHWCYEGMPLAPDQPFDKDGVYSGSALIHQGQMFLYYTGNVKQPGEHDYISSGREANTILVTSRDGKKFSEKQCLMTNADYPEEYTCHIRDPKVWRQPDGSYYMVQGGRLKSDKGTVLLFRSEDLCHWQFHNDVTTEETFGYMWECPDYFELGTTDNVSVKKDIKKILSLSPQGLKPEMYRYQNIYQSGYFQVEGDITGDAKLYRFTEWDMGFDFYAPQTFQDEQGRRILIGWAGIPDADYDNKPTVDKGWQHALTVPRVLTWQNEKVYQKPVEELNQLRTVSFRPKEREKFSLGTEPGAKKKAYDIEVADITSEECQVRFEQAGSGFVLRYGKEIFSLEFYGEQAAKIGRGRTVRRLKMQCLDKLRILLDTSLVEIYLNDGEFVLTSRYYMADGKFDGEICCPDSKNLVWEMKGLQVE